MEFIIFFGAVAVGGFFAYRMISRTGKDKPGLRSGKPDKSDESV